MDFDKLFAIQEQVESGGNPLAVSPKGAVGPMQTMPRTLVDPGYGVRPAANDSVEEKRRVGQDYMKAMLKEYGDDLPTALAAYNWGPGSVNKWKKEGADPAKLPAETRDYITKITGQLEPQVPPRRVQPAPTYSDLKLGREAALRNLWVASINQPRSAEATQAAVVAENAATLEAFKERPTGLEMLGAAIDGNTSSSLYRSLFRPNHPEEPGYKPDFNVAPADTTSALLHKIAGSKSSAETQQYIAEFEEDKLRGQTLMSRGLAPGLALSLVGEFIDPVNLVTPFAAAKALRTFGVGSEAMFAAGRTSAGVGSAVTENLLSGTAIEAVKQSLNGEFKPQDLAISLVADGLIGVGSGLLGARAAANRMLTRAATEAVEREMMYAKRAEERLGADASPEELRAAMQEEYAKDAAQPVTSTASTIPEGEKLVTEPRAVAQADAEQAPVASPKADFDTEEALTIRREEFAPGGVHEKEILIRTGGMIKNLAGLEALPSGVHVSPGLVLNHKPAFDTLAKLARKFLPDTTITLHSGEIPLPGGGKANADIVQVSDKIAMIRIDPNLPVGQAVRSAVHEIGHAIFNTHLSKVSPEQRAKLVKAFNEFLATAKAGTPDGNKARAMRFSLTNASLMPEKERTVPLKSDYELDWDEFSAEQFSKFLEEDTALGNKHGLHANVVRIIKDAIHSALAWLKFAKRENLGVTNEYREFFETLANDPVVAAARGEPTRPVLGLKKLAQASMPAKAPAVVDEIMTDPDAVRFGLHLAPVGTAIERKQVQAMIALHKKAEVWEKANPMDAAWEQRMQNLADNSVFSVASTGLTMLKSPSPLVRMLASELLEDASGVAGKRRNTAAIDKYLIERQMQGNALNDVEGAYELWNATQPGANLRDTLFLGQQKAKWNKLLASEIEARRIAKGPVSQDGNVKAAVDSLEAAYQRIANAQRSVNTLGSEGLPLSSVGYMPHRMSPGAVMNLTNEQTQVLHDALVDQFITIEGWDMSFADKLAATYIMRVRKRASGDYGSNIGGGSAGASSLVEEALRGMDLPEDTIKNHMDKFNKGAANYTKGRIELDLNRVYQVQGGEFRLLDIFETDQIELLRSQVGSASGDVALTKHGIRGKAGMQLLRDAMDYGEDGKKAVIRDKEAFDQIAAEFRNEPFGTAAGKWMNRAMSANTLVRLGGIMYNQFAESINGVFHVGAARTAQSITSIPRLRAEIIALSKGQKVDNGILGSIELVGGAEFGTDSYKFVLPFDSPDHSFPTYGKDTLTATDRLLRGGGHLQAKLSGWRMIHAAQQRGMAEQIVHKMMRYVRDGKEDVALEQFGIHKDIRDALRKDMAKVARWDGDRLVEFDVTQITDDNIREQVIHAVHRGTSQIIQGTFIGERGKWAHDGMMRLMTQFRTFGITSMEKQWGRQRNSRGTFGAFGLALGAMSMAAPIYMARTYAASIGREDQEAFLEERLQPQMVARATLNYIATAGLAGDFIDLTTSVLPEDWGVKPTGGRAGVESDFVGNYIVPASSLVDDIWKYAQSPLEADDLAKVLPMRNVPFILPLMNLTKD